MSIDVETTERMAEIHRRANALGLHVSSARNQHGGTGGLTSDARYVLCVPATTEPGAHVELTMAELAECVARWEEGADKSASEA